MRASVRPSRRSGHLRRGLGAIAVLLVVVLVAGNAAGQPVVLGYVETGSMAPQLQPGDGFLAVPAALTTTSVGDVIVYDAAVVNGGRLTTHRVVAVTPEGYVTQGDANRFTDQAGREPPVVEAQVVAEVVQVGGRVVPVPHLGTAVDAVRGSLSWVGATVRAVVGVDVGGPRALAAVAFLGGLALYVLGRVLGGPERVRRTRVTPTNGVPVRSLVLVGLLAMLVVTTAATAVPSGPTQYDVVSADIDAPGVRVIPSGTAETGSHSVAAAPFPTVVFLQSGSDPLVVSESVVTVAAGETREVAFTVTAPAERGYYRYYLVEHRYPAALPQPLLADLYAVHPWAPTLVLNAFVGAVYLLVTFPLLRSGSRLRLPARSRPWG